MYIITIDAGTSNTRATLWQNGAPIGYASKEVGCRDTAITGNNEKLKDAVRDAITELIKNAALTEGDIKAVIASGMITSNMGLVEIPHIRLPAGKKELAQAMTAVEIPGVWQKPIWFAAGLKKSGGTDDWDSLSLFDVIRGEEAEITGLVERLSLAGQAAWIVLPGSHSKYIYLNEKSEVEYFFTTLAGEMFAVIAGNTILANSVSVKSISGQASDDLLAGARLAAETGLTRACFVIRPTHLFSNKSETERSDFLLGAIFASDMELLRQKDRSLNNSNIPIIVAGRSELKTVIAALLEKEEQFRGRVTEADDKTIADLSGYGALVLARERGIV
jgi:2-dehydro-3-deoxygalactonokinase